MGGMNSLGESALTAMAMAMRWLKERAPKRSLRTRVYHVTVSLGISIAAEISLLLKPCATIRITSTARLGNFIRERLATVWNPLHSSQKRMLVEK